MGKGSGGGGDSTVKVRYASYIEDHHSRLLNDYAYGTGLTLLQENPYASFDPLTSVDEAFLGPVAKGVQISDFPSIYGLMSVFVTNVDIQAKFDSILDSTMNSPVIDNQVSAHADMLDDEINEVTLPRFATGMRDMNAVISSTFVIGKALVETARTKAVSRYDAEIRTKLYEVALRRWQVNLEWNTKVVPMYLEMIRMYMSGKNDQSALNAEMSAKEKLWKFSVLEPFKYALGVMQGATNSTTDVQGASPVQRAFGGALSGASAGMMLSGGSPIGGAIGGVVGLASSFF